MIFRWLTALLFVSGIFQTSYATNNSIDHWETVVMANDTWRYFVGLTSNPSGVWQSSQFDDSAWKLGPGGFGYADGDDATVISTTSNPYSVFIRIKFNILDTSKISLALLNMDFDDGFAAWINGVEIARSNLGTVGDNPAYNTAAVDHEAVMYQQKVPASYLISKQKLNGFLLNGSNVLAIQVNNTGINSSDMSCIPFLSMAMNTAGMTYRDVPDWFENPYVSFSGSTLPLVIINTGSAIQQDVKSMVDMGIIDNGPGEMNNLTDNWNNYNGKAGIEIRGSSSTMFDKKNYGIELWKTTNVDTAFSLMDLPAESDWILHGPYSDKTLVRNYLAYELARNMGHYASRTRFCELFLNNQYQGVYVLIERIKRDSSRVDIAKLLPTDVTGEQLTGGYIVKIDRSAGNFTDGWFSPFIGTGTEGTSPFFAYVYPQRDKIGPVQKTYIKNKITAFENALHGRDFLDPIVGYKTFIDLSSFVDYFILVELSKNTDGYRLSTFLHKDRDGKDPRIHMGPAWDYDIAFGNADYYEAFNTSGWSYAVQSDMWGTPFWWSKMLTDPYFVNMLYCRWHEFRKGVLSDESIVARIDSAVTVIGDATDRNFIQWPIHGLYVWPNYYVGNTYEQDVDYMKTWIHTRALWLDSHIPGSSCLSPVSDIDATYSFLLRAYPNPAIEEVNIEVQNEKFLKLNLEIFNYTGQLVYARPLAGGPLITEKIKLQPGAYLVKVSGKENSKIQKIIVQ